MSRPSAFICHGSVDKPFARRLVQDLKRFGVTVWFDEDEVTIGDSLTESIQAGLAHSDYTIVVLSKAALGRPWVRKEMAASLMLEIDKNQKRILPVLLDDCEVPPFLMDKKYADCRISYERGLETILEAFGMNTSSTWDTAFSTERSVVTLDIVSRDGSIVTYTKVACGRAVRDAINDTTEHFTSDGTLANFKVTPGTIAKTWNEGGVTFVRTALPKPLVKGDLLERTFSMEMHNAFASASEYWESKMDGPIHRYRLQVKFPDDRLPTRWEVSERSGGRDFPSSMLAKMEVVDGRQTLVQEIDAPVLHRSYVLRWWW